MTIKISTLLQFSQVAVWTGVACNALALAATLITRADHWALYASAQSASLVVCGIAAWRAQVLAERDAALTGRAVAERLMAETMLRKMADASMTVEVEDEDAHARRH